MAKIRKIGVFGRERSRNVVDEIRASGIYFLKRDDGAWAFQIKLPGQGEPLELSAADLAGFADLVGDGAPEGGDALSVAQRTSQWNGDGDLTFRVSTAERARAVKVPAAQQVEVAALLMSLVDKVDDMVAEYQGENDGDEGNDGDDGSTEGDGSDAGE